MQSKQKSKMVLVRDHALERARLRLGFTGSDAEVTDQVIDVFDNSRRARECRNAVEYTHGELTFRVFEKRQFIEIVTLFTNAAEAAEEGLYA